MSALKVCPTCSHEYPADERFCARDGSALRAQGREANDLVGSIIGDRYHVLSKLGEGGMGQVYLAEHVKMGRRSAVKVLHPGMVNDADAIGRFNREAANASRINHPNVAAIYDFGETTEGLIYLAMELVDGMSLAALIAQVGTLDAARAASITLQVADALSVAHDMGIVHRDLKPDNIMIGRNRDGSDLVKVVDFGIAKAAGKEGQTVTRTGHVIGTPEYMSPEQLAGDVLDGRSDQYSLALVAFNMFTGLLPFPGATSRESMTMRLTERPRRLGEMRPDLPWSDEVQEVMDRALEPNPADRYPQTVEFGRALWHAVNALDAALRGTSSPQLGHGFVPSATFAQSRTISGPVVPRSTSTPNGPAGVLGQASGPISGQTAAPQFTTEELAQVQAKLTNFVGPIAGLLVKRAAAKATDRNALVALLAQELDDDTERQSFVKQCRQLR